MRRSALARIELLTLSCILLGSLTLVSLTVRQSRGQYYRTICSNNTKRLVLALQNYADTFLNLPSGAMQRTTAKGAKHHWGPSWFVGTLPFAEQRPLFDKMYATTLKSPEQNSKEMLTLIHDVKIPYLTCPESPLPPMQKVEGEFNLAVASYAAIMGAKPDDKPAKPDDRFVDGPYKGIATANGMLPINEFLAFKDCLDGIANVIIVGEVSDWYYDDNGKKMNPALNIADAGNGPNAASGWTMGNNLNYLKKNVEGRRRQFIRQDSPAIPQDRVCNVISIQHPVGTNNKLGLKDSDPAWETAGIARCGLNNPLISAHNGGKAAVVGYLDGHTNALSSDTELDVLRHLAIRDDGVPIPEKYIGR